VYQLIGLRVTNRENEKIGTVGQIIHGRGNDVLVVSGEKELLVPMVEGHILHIDLEKGFVRVDEETLLP
jgi:16S rRNA processing protein RimM